MQSRSNDRVVKKGWFLYDHQSRCEVEIIQTDFRPGSMDDEDPQADAYGEFYEIQYKWPDQPSRAGGGYHDTLEDAIRGVEKIVRDVRWE